MRRLLFAAVLCTGPALAVLPSDTDDSDDPDAPRVQGERAVRTGRYDLGIPFLREALGRTPDEPDIHVYLALALRQTGALAESAEHYEAALRLAPDHKAAIAYQGVLKLALNDRAGAEANMARLRQLCPQGCNERDDLARELARDLARAR